MLERSLPLCEQMAARVPALKRYMALFFLPLSFVAFFKSPLSVLPTGQPLPERGFRVGVFFSNCFVEVDKKRIPFPFFSFLQSPPFFFPPLQSRIPHNLRKSPSWINYQHPFKITFLFRHISNLFPQEFKIPLRQQSSSRSRFRVSVFFSRPRSGPFNRKGLFLK